MLRIIDVGLHGLLHYCFANDTQLNFFISEWMASNRLKLIFIQVWVSMVHHHPASTPTWLQCLRTWWYWSPTSRHHPQPWSPLWKLYTMTVLVS